jgi:prepilin-type N-terminal cleavage/methylation domain-containing protein
MNLNISNRALGTKRKMKTSPVGPTPDLNGRIGPVSAFSGSKTVRGMTLPEMMVSVGVGSLVLMIMAVVFTSSARSFAALGHYVSMDRNSRAALDRMSREIRQAGDLIEFSPTRLKFVSYEQTNSFLVYNWDATSRELTEWKTGQATTNVLLNECDDLAFKMSRVSLAPTTVVAEGKAIKVNWKCSRTILGKKSTSEDMGQALIIIRNKAI